MNPSLFGRGTWVLFFQFFFYFIKNLNKKKNYLLIIKNDNKTIEERTKYLNKFNNIYHDFILNKTEKEIIDKMYKNDTENLKKKLVILISSLPCHECKNHCLENMEINKILNSDSIFYIFHFFIELRNIFYNNKIDRTLFNTEESILNNEKYLFETIIKN